MSGGQERRADQGPKYALHETGDEVFDEKEVAIAAMADARPCWTECSDALYHLLRLPADDLAFEGPRVYLVTTQSRDFCGSGGCYRSFMVLRDGRMRTVNTWATGLGDRQASLVAREILAQVRTEK